MALSFALQTRKTPAATPSVWGQVFEYFRVLQVPTFSALTKPSLKTLGNNSRTADSLSESSSSLDPLPFAQHFRKRKTNRTPCGNYEEENELVKRGAKLLPDENPVGNEVNKVRLRLTKRVKAL